jgi:hypothetical protein
VAPNQPLIHDHVWNLQKNSRQLSPGFSPNVKKKMMSATIRYLFTEENLCVIGN